MKAILESLQQIYDLEVDSQKYKLLEIFSKHYKPVVM